MQVARLSGQQKQQMSMAQAAAPAPLFPWLGEPRRTVIQVEVFVVGAAVLLFVQLIFGFCRRQSSNKFIQGGVWVAYTLTFPLVTYTLGMMQSSPIKSQMYPVWAMSLFLVAGCTNSITAYDLDDNKQWKRHLFELLQYYFYVGMIFRLLSPSHLTPLSIVADAFKIKGTPIHTQPISIPSSVLFAMIFFTNLLRVIACWMVNFSDPSKVVADYMRDQADSRDAQVQGYNPIRMKGYKYLVQWYGHTLIPHDAKLPNYRNKLVGDIVTIDMIWEKCNDRLFESNGDSQLKDVCLSFALFHLLKRRFFGMTCYEAVLPETRDFVFKGLLSEDDDDYARAFRIIEVELGFLHDFFFTKYASIYEMEIVFFVTFILKIIFTVMLGVFVYRYSLILETLSPFIKVDTKTVDTIITLVIIGALLIADILQAMLYMASDWALVSLACNYVRNGSWCKIRYSLLRKAIWIFRRGNLFQYWQNKIGQYSVIEGCRWHVFPTQELQAFFPFFIIWNIEILYLKTIWKILTCQYCRSIVHFVRLPDTVKREIASSLKSSSNGYLTNGEASLQRNAVLSRVSLTWNKGDWNQTDTMLIWHIATNYCEIALPQVAEMGRNSDQEVRHYREVATKLSRYAAYLMACVPELLPDNSADTKFTFDKVMEEATEALYPAIHRRAWNGPMVDRDKLLEVIDGSRSDQGNDTIFVKGLKLGRELEGIQNSVFRWKVMAEFWSETILYVAPSNNVRGHVEQLANGGEFLTHVWALLSHAGILTRRKKQESQDIV